MAIEQTFGRRVRSSASSFPLVSVLAMCVGLLALYLPTVFDLANGLWQDDTHSHGPLVLAGVVGLFVHGLRAHAVTHGGLVTPAARAWGGVALAVGLLGYVLGRSQGLYVLEVGSAIPVLLGCVLIAQGTALALRLWFAFVFMLFLVPLPGSVIDTLTQPIKVAVSYVAEMLMHTAGYPVARQGVVMGIGPYQLFVADACAGLNSLFMLEAFGLLYMNVIRHESALRNVVLAVLILPISFAANVTRVVVLALVTYHYGDAAGQGFIHSFSGVALFATALLLTVLADSLVRTAAQRFGWQRPEVAARAPAPSAAASGASLPRPMVLSAPTGLAIGACAVLAAVTALVLTPKPDPVAARPDLESAIPRQFGSWKMIDLPYVPVSVVPLEPGKNSIDQPYDQSIVRAYANASGQVVALAVAYAANQRQEVKIHRPELCYVAQGFHIVDQERVDFGGLPGARRGSMGNRMHAQSTQGSEAVSYWVRVGSTFTESSWDSRKAIIAYGFSGRLPDGVLVRASTILRRASEAPAGYELNEGFLRELTAAVSEPTRALILGTAAPTASRQGGRHEPDPNPR